MVTAHFNVVNAAAGGWGTAHYVAYTEEFGNIVRPEIIFVFLNTDDVGRSFKSALYSFEDRDSLVLARDRIRPDTFKALTEFIPFYDWSLENLHSLQLLRKAYLTLASGHADTCNENGPGQLDLLPHSDNSHALQISEAVDLTKALFLRLKRWADENGSELYVTTTGWHRPPSPPGHSWPSPNGSSTKQAYLTRMSRLTFFGHEYGRLRVSSSRTMGTQMSVGAS